MERLKLHIKNLGPIKETSIEIAPLTIICGSNNSGKTYISYCIYGLLQTWNPSISTGIFKENAIELKETGKTTLDLGKTFQNKDKIFSELEADFAESIDVFFSAPAGTFKDFKLEVENEFKLPESNDYVFEVNSPRLGKLHYKQIGSTIEITSLEEDRNFDIGRAQQLLEIYGALAVFDDYFPEPFIVTAERLGISLFYKELDSNRNALVDSLLNLKDSKSRINPHEILERAVSRYSRPVKDHINFTRDLADIKKSKGALQSEKEKIYTEIETLLGGEYKISGDEIHFKSKSKKDPYQIPSYLGSSAVRSLADVYFYLKHKARIGDILLIDEPESHLTPKNQILFARTISRLIGFGVNVFITTHSDFLIKELSNLIQLNKEFPERDNICKKYGYKKTDRLDPTVVAAYVAKDGKLEACPVTTEGIEVATFDDAIDLINSISNDLDYYS
ncbi:AAA family ATPase [Pseudomonas nitroreducens]|uniref:AAA family ATPase n=1 Tax=Pseudomonas nitroreducens TaxID=46680 RepID=UPI003809E8B0